MKQFTSFMQKGFVFKRGTCARQRRQVFKRGSVAIPRNMYVLISTEKRHISTEKLDFYACRTCVFLRRRGGPYGPAYKSDKCSCFKHHINITRRWVCKISLEKPNLHFRIEDHIVCAVARKTHSEYWVGNLNITLLKIFSTN